MPGKKLSTKTSKFKKDVLEKNIQVGKVFGDIVYWNSNEHEFVESGSSQHQLASLVVATASLFAARKRA